MDKKYEEMTREQLGIKADEILKKAKLDIYGNADVPTRIRNIDNLQEIINIMKTFEIDATKEKIDNILGGFLDKNNQYTIEVYISNGVTNNRIGRLTISTDRVFKTDGNKFTLEWDVNGKERCNTFSFEYEEIMDCYVDHDIEYVAQTAVVLMKNGVKVDFICCGM